MARLKDFLTLQSSPQLDGQLVTITSVLGASATWVGQEFVAEELKSSVNKGRRGRIEIGVEDTHAGDGGDGGASKTGGAVVVSFMHHMGFWIEGLRRGGIDITQQISKGQFMFLDGLTALFNDAYVPGAALHQGSNVQSIPNPSAQSVPHNRRTSLPIRESSSLVSTAPAPADGYSDAGLGQSNKDIKLKVNVARGGNVQDRNDPCKGIYDSISKAILKAYPSSCTNPTSTTPSSSKPERKPLLVIEYPDLLVAAADIPAQDIWSLIVDLRELCSTCIVLLNADAPFLTPSLELTKEGSQLRNTHSQITRLETQLSSLLATTVHNSYFTVSLRMLGTGVAKDISGVMRITRGGDMTEWARERETEAGAVGRTEEKEILYYVGASGVQVFERGEAR